MRRFARSDAYVKMRLVNGAVFMLFGVVLLVRGIAAPGAAGAKVPLFVLSAAMFLLGLFRFRVYLQARAAGARPPQQR